MLRQSARDGENRLIVESVQLNAWGVSAGRAALERVMRGDYMRRRHLAGPTRRFLQDAERTLHGRRPARTMNSFHVDRGDLASRLARKARFARLHRAALGRIDDQLGGIG